MFLDAPQYITMYHNVVMLISSEQAPTSSSQFVACTAAECTGKWVRCRYSIMRLILSERGGAALEKSSLPNVRFIPKQNKLRAITNLSKKDIDVRVSNTQKIVDGKDIDCCFFFFFLMIGQGNGTTAAVSNLTLNSAFQVLKSVCADW